MQLEATSGATYAAAKTIRGVRLRKMGPRPASAPVAELISPEELLRALFCADASRLVFVAALDARTLSRFALLGNLRRFRRVVSPP